MSRFHIFVFLILLTNNIGYSQTQKYFTAFCGKAASLNSLGHAFIMTGKGTPFTCSIENGDGEAYGLYASEGATTSCKPKALNAAKSYFIGDLPGCLFNDINTEVSNYLIVPCTFEEYLKVHGEIIQWKSKKYQIKEQDCLSFVIAVTKIFSDKLIIPSREGFDNLPNQFILKLKKYNPSIK